MSLAVNELIDDPELPEKVDALRRLLESERERRARFYDEVSEEEKAEFISGEVVMHSPARDKHTATRHRLERAMSIFCDSRALGSVRGEKSLCVFPRNDYEPDVVFFGPEKAALIQPDTLKFPVPDFICEVLSESTEHRDRGVKFRDFEAHGVGEYWLIDPERELLEQFLLRAGRYELALKSGTGEVASAVVPGFRIPIRALFDDAENLRVLRAVLA
jgi:Uma2 family endonuclease